MTGLKKRIRLRGRLRRFLRKGRYLLLPVFLISPMALWNRLQEEAVKVWRDREILTAALLAFWEEDSRSLILCGMLLIILLVLRRSVRVYSYDSSGECFYLGSVLLRQGEECSIYLPSYMLEKSETTRYCIRLPAHMANSGKWEKKPFFLYGRGLSQELNLSAGMKFYVEKKTGVV